MIFFSKVNYHISENTLKSSENYKYGLISFLSMFFKNQQLQNIPPNLNQSLLEENQDPTSINSLQENKSHQFPRIHDSKNGLSLTKKAARKNLKKLPLKFNYPIPPKEVKQFMIEVFLKRFPNGSDLYQGKLSSKKGIKNSSTIELAIAFEEWEKQEGYETIRRYFDLVANSKQIPHDDHQFINDTDHVQDEIHSYFNFF